MKFLSKSLICLAILLLIVGGFVAWRQWQDNEHADDVAAANQYRANHGHATGDDPSTVKPGADAFQNWQVAADQPRYIFIPKIHVQTVVKPVSLTSSGAVGAPNNVYDAAWYVGSAKPGTAGATLIDGHVSSWTTNGVFHDLKLLQPGDELQLEKGNGQILTYKVVKTAVYAVDKVDMRQVLSPVTPGRSGLNLMTCTGNVISGTSEFNQRAVVYSLLE